MHNSVNALILSIFIACVAITLLLQVKQVSFSMEQIGSKLTSLDLNTEDLQTIKYYINSVEYPLTVQEDSYKANFYDMSSRIDLNFVDSTLFKKPEFRKLLKPGVTYNDFEIVRNQVGFTSNLDSYKEILSNNIKLSNYFTTYSIPNVNNMSDIILKNYLLLYTRNLKEIEKVISWVQDSRLNHRSISTDQLRNYIINSNIKLSDILTTTPSWNRDYIPIELLNLSRAISEYSKNFYIGNRTTFWLVEIQDKKTNRDTSIIFKWDEEESIYKVISIFRNII